MNSALAVAGFGATVLWLGLARKSLLRSDLVVVKGLTVVGSIGGTGDFPDVLRFLAGHEGRAASLVTHRFRAEEAERALARVPGGGPVIKAQLEF
jgi:threonine dehydrogenase-like Zn-dependent dehydrogenase